MNLLETVLATPQDAAMLIGAFAAAVVHYGCCMFRGKPFEPGRLLIFVVSAAGMVAGVYVFFEALRASVTRSIPAVSSQNVVWAGIGGLCAAAFTLDLLTKEIRELLRKPDVTATPAGVEASRSEKAEAGSPSPGN